MLLLFLGIFFQYVLVNCGEEKANGENEFMDYSITEFWWNGTPRIDQTDRITPQYSFLPTPVGWIMNADYPPHTPLEPWVPIEDLKTFYPFPNTTRPSYPFDIKNYTIVPPPRVGPTDLPEPWHIQYPGLTPPPNFPSDYKYPTIYPYTTLSPYIPSPTGPTPKGPTFTLPEVDRPKFTYPTLTKYPPGYDPDWVPPSITPRPEYSPSTWDPIGQHVQKWKQGISSYAAADSKPTIMAPIISQVFNYDDKTGGLREEMRRILEIPQDAASKLRNSVSENQTRTVLREETTVIERQGAKQLVFADQLSLYDPKPSNHTQTLTTITTPKQNTDVLRMSQLPIGNERSTVDDDNIKKNETIVRLLMTQDRPVTLLEGEWKQSDQTATTTLTTAKEFLRQIADAHSYFEMIETLQEGYMMVFLIELSRLVATKERKAVHDVVKHADQIIFSIYRSRQWQWLGVPLIDVTNKIARLLKQLKIDVIQNHAANLHYVLSQRHQTLSVEVNTILEYADMLYDDDEGRLLFDALKEFAAYPNISISGYWLCNSLIHNFLRPYRRLKDTQEREELMNSVNFLLKTRLSASGLNVEPPLRDGDVKQAHDPPDETELLIPKELLTQTEPRSDTIRSPGERKRKRHYRLHKRRRVRKRYPDKDLT